MPLEAGYRIDHSGWTDISQLARSAGISGRCGLMGCAMLDSVRTFLMLDQPTFTMALIWLPVMFAVLALNLTGLGKPAERERSKAPAQSGRKRPEGGSFFVRIGREALGILVRSGVTPNQVTLIGLFLVLLNCGLYLVYKDPFLFGMGLILSYVFDALDGLVARAQGTTSRFGGYLDAIVDRIQEAATLCVVGVVSGLWLPAFLVITGSMMTSYNKARAAIEIPVANKGWPDFFNKASRQFFLCFALIASHAVPWMLHAGLWILAAATYFTAFQRIARTWFLICAYEAGLTASEQPANPGSSVKS